MVAVSNPTRERPGLLDHELERRAESNLPVVGLAEALHAERQPDRRAFREQRPFDFQSQTAVTAVGDEEDATTAGAIAHHSLNGLDEDVRSAHRHLMDLLAQGRDRRMLAPMVQHGLQLIVLSPE